MSVGQIPCEFFTVFLTHYFGMNDSWSVHEYANKCFKRFLLIDQSLGFVTVTIVCACVNANTEGFIKYFIQVYAECMQMRMIHESITINMHKGSERVDPMRKR